MIGRGAWAAAGWVQRLARRWPSAATPSPAAKQEAGWYGLLDGAASGSQWRGPPSCKGRNVRAASSEPSSPARDEAKQQARSLAERRAAISAGLAQLDAHSSASDGTAGAWTTKQSGKFVDRLLLDVQAGHGGNGGVCFVSKYRIPDGGHGGPGGDVIIRASEKARSLAGIQVLQRAGRGGQGGPQKRTGAPGKSRVVTVPLGTAVSIRALDDADGEDPDMYSWMLKPNQPIVGGEDSDSDEDLGNMTKVPDFEAVADLMHHGQELCVVEGGRGGTGNSVYGRQKSVRSDAQAVMELRCGQPGQLLKVKLELKSLADVGLIGMPNAGKSTLLRAVSAATPEVGSYPFTTLSPQLGSVPDVDGASTTMADIPGLIEGAHENRGLGHAFLRHVERTRVLVYVLDASRTGTSGHKDKHDMVPSAQLNLLVHELEQYDPLLLGKPSLVAANKVDALGGPEEIRKVLQRLQQETGWPVLAISGKENVGMKEFVDTVRGMCTLRAGQAATE